MADLSYQPRETTGRGKVKSGRRVVSAFIGTAFAQETPEASSQQWRTIADQMRPKLPKLATLMDDAEPDVLPYMAFPKEHRVKLHSNNAKLKHGRLTISQLACPMCDA